MLKRQKHELKEQYQDRKKIYELVLKKNKDRATVLSNIYVNIKYMGNKYPKELEDELNQYIAQL
ncbi:unnamed protein product [Paramecium sonneborni]|uniref:Uncharacterized protein n=1 Tax=Paramecium sonneborni TaxID=65129 RepID=A0A8S1N561_9CILI|nr:unnamed protein product [Paramecium sonneborni]